MEISREFSLLSFESPIAFLLSIDELATILELFGLIGQFTIAVHQSLVKLSSVDFVASSVSCYFLRGMLFLLLNISVGIKAVLQSVDELADILSVVWWANLMTLTEWFVIVPLTFISVGELMDEFSSTF